MKIKWKKRAVGGWITEDGKWSIRGPIYSKPMYWVYGPADRRGRAERYTPSGKYDDAVNFKSVAAAKRFVENL